MKTIQQIILISVISFSVYFSYNIGYKSGINDGFSISLDTANKILQKQLKSDTSVTELIMINPYTNVYILSRKTLLTK